MTGMQEYLAGKNNNIQKLIDQNKNLKGFAYFLNGSSEDTIYNYLLKVDKFLKMVNKPPKDLEFDDFLEFINKSKIKQDGTPSGKSYRVIAYQSLKKYGDYLVARKTLEDNPMRFIPRPSGKESQTTIEKREKGFLNETEMKTYLKSVNEGVGSSRSISRQNNWKERDKAIILVFLTTGIRCSALYRIDLSDLNFENNTLIVTDKESKVTIYSLPDITVQALKEWLVKREKMLVNCPEPTEALFISNRLNRISRNSIGVLVKKYAQNITGKNISPHKLRATYGTLLYNETKDIYFVQKCMNHSSPHTTEKYIRGQNNRASQAANIMESLLK